MSVRMNGSPRVSLSPFPPEGGPAPGSASCPLLFSFQQVQLTGACQSHVVALCELSLGVLTVWAAIPLAAPFPSSYWATLGPSQQVYSLLGASSTHLSDLCHCTPPIMVLSI